MRFPSRVIYGDTFHTRHFLACGSTLTLVTSIRVHLVCPMWVPALCEQIRCLQWNVLCARRYGKFTMSASFPCTCTGGGVPKSASCGSIF